MKLHLDIPQSTRDEITELQKLMKATTATEAIRRSLSTSHAMLSHVSNGGMVLLRDSDGTTRLVQFV